MTESWGTFGLECPIFINRDVNQLNLDTPSAFEFRPGSRTIKAPDGTEFLPEVELVTESGEIISLEFSGARFYQGHRFVGFRNDNRLTKGMTIKELRIRSTYEFVTPTIWFSSYNIKDMP